MSVTGGPHDRSRKAYKAAQRLIAEAARDQAGRLDLDTPETHALITLPPEIGNLSAVWKLDLRNTQIIDVTPLNTLTSLFELHLSDTPISDASSLEALTSLTWLTLENTQIADITPLAALSSLTTLVLNNTLITDAAPLATLKALTSLSLQNTQITDATPLAALTALTRLNLTNSAVLDMRPLRQLTALDVNPRSDGLSFRNTPATCIAKIALERKSSIRARELFSYLETWVPPDEHATKPKPDPIFETP